LNAITDLPSSDSNNSLDNSSFVYSRKDPSHKNNCFKPQVESYAETEHYERKATEPPGQPNNRLSNESNQSLLYKYPADNEYPFQANTQSEFIYGEARKSNQSKSIHEYQPKNHQPVPSTFLTTSQKTQNLNQSQASPRSSLNNSTSPKSPTVNSQRRPINNRYVNATSIETPI
jgi:hypothetical protein